MHGRRLGNRHALRFEKGEQVMPALLKYLEREGIGYSSVSGAGGVRSARLGYWDSASNGYVDRDLHEQLEVLTFTGNTSLLDGRPHLHVHAVFGRRDLTTLGGHVKEAEVYPTLEVWLSAEDVPVQRCKDDETGLDLLDL